MGRWILKNITACFRKLSFLLQKCDLRLRGNISQVWRDGLQIWFLALIFNLDHGSIAAVFFYFVVGSLSLLRRYVEILVRIAVLVFQIKDLLAQRIFSLYPVCIFFLLVPFFLYNCFFLLIKSIFVRMCSQVKKIFDQAIFLLLAKTASFACWSCLQFLFFWDVFDHACDQVVGGYLFPMLHCRDSSFLFCFFVSFSLSLLKFLELSHPSFFFFWSLICLITFFICFFLLCFLFFLFFMFLFKSMSQLSFASDLVGFLGLFFFFKFLKQTLIKFMKALYGLLAGIFCKMQTQLAMQWQTLGWFLSRPVFRVHSV